MRPGSPSERAKLFDSRPCTSRDGLGAEEVATRVRRRRGKSQGTPAPQPSSSSAAVVSGQFGLWNAQPGLHSSFLWTQGEAADSARCRPRCGDRRSALWKRNGLERKQAALRRPRPKTGLSARQSGLADLLVRL